jgi:hypothetical protein
MAAADRPGRVGVARGADQGCGDDQPSAPSQRGRVRQRSDVGDRLQASSAGGVLADAQPLPHVSNPLTGLRDRGLDVTRSSWWPSMRQRRYARRCSTSLTTRWSALPAAQDPQRARPVARALDRGQADARRRPRRLGPRRRSAAHRTGPRAGQDPPGCGRQPARRTRGHLGPRPRPSGVVQDQQGYTS